MANTGELERISLQDCITHSVQVDWVDVVGKFQLKILPWAGAQLQKCMPLVTKVMRVMSEKRLETKKNTVEKCLNDAVRLLAKDKDAVSDFSLARTHLINLYNDMTKGESFGSNIDAIIAILEDERYTDEVWDAIYMTIERGNKTITIDKKQLSLFTKEEMKEWFPLPLVIEIIRLVLTQNYLKNLSTGSEAKAEEPGGTDNNDNEELSGQQKAKVEKEKSKPLPMTTTSSA